MKTSKISKHKPRASATELRVWLGRVTLLLLMMPAAIAMPPVVSSIWHYVLMALGFSLIIFVHELGHFVVARWCSVKCEVFSIGIGHRLVGWKKGRGLSFGPEKDVTDAKTGEDLTGETGGAGLVSLGDMPQTAVDPDKLHVMPASAGTEIGETDYRISMLPIGGYVKMLGQDDMDSSKVSSDPRSFNRRPIWQRMCIVSAGVVMNIIFAFVVFVIVFQHGINFPPAVVGGVTAGSPADRAGFQVGDEIVAIDGVGPVTKDSFLEFMDVAISSALSKNGSEITYTVRRGDQLLTKKLKAEKGENGMLQVGLLQGIDLKLMTFDDDPESQKALQDLAKPYADLKSGERVVAVGGKPVKDYGEYHRLLQDTAGEPVELTFEEPDGTTRKDTFKPELIHREGIALNNLPSIVGLYPRTRIMAVVPESAAAKAGLPSKGIVLFCENTNNPTINQIVNTIWKGDSVSLMVEGDPRKYTITPKAGETHPMIGVQFSYDIDSAIIAGVDEDNPKLAGIASGSKVVSVNGAAVANWNQVLAKARDAIKDGHSRSVTLEIGSDGGEKRSVTIPLPAAVASGDTKPAEATGSATQPAPGAEYAQALGELQYSLTELPLAPLQKDQRSSSAWGACLLGFDHTRNFVLQVYSTLRGAFSGTVPVNQFHGALGMFKIGHEVQQRSDGFMYLVYLLGVISVNLAVANFLPLPIVDGGLFILLIIEKIRGQPLPVKVLEYIQVAGLVLLGSLFLFVTYNDLSLFK